MITDIRTDVVKNKKNLRVKNNRSVASSRNDHSSWIQVREHTDEKQKIGSRYQKYSTLKWRPDAIDKNVQRRIIERYLIDGQVGSEAPEETGLASRFKRARHGCTAVPLAA